ncbi:MAG TPA: 16S rRNA (guanine(527)-N(7))-methyltransferase RsmG [Acidiferrobacterales bacterium]|nr:16S rRNA (guanine(527)-N(7))-methyltransferase RsmG [Acidiferrobacterales bacterium]
MLEKILTQGLQALKLRLPPEARRALLDFVLLLDKWNQAYNLTAVRDPQQMITRHILDSLSVLPFVKGPRVLDVGSGAGLPGIPLALAQPQLDFVLLDSNAKKTRFITQAVADLRIKNVEIAQERVEKYQPRKKFNTLISRAFASIADMLASTGHLADAGAEFLAMKGVYPQEELAAIPQHYQVSSVQALQVPGLDAARHLVIITGR